MLALTFDSKEDYNKILEDDTIDIEGLLAFSPGKNLQVVLNHTVGGNETIQVKHSYNAQQIEWFKAGGALNVIRAEFAKG
jgi:aconitate hydratase